ncbi:MAG: DUF2190 family protein [Pseudorhodoplanes sp.]|nr:DUF2190 family protein [Pseudorhodoplanes sp.]
MKNYIQEGRMITLAAPAGGVTSGDGVMVGALFGVASKIAGDPVAWDDTAKEVSVPGTDRYPIGIAIEAAGNGATIVRVRLDGIATAAAA